MARPLRIELAGGLYHVTSRGDRREDIYRDDEDRAAWLEVFASVCMRFNWRCYAYCLMGNHYHVCLRTPEGNLARVMRHLDGLYTQRFNRLHRRDGALFRGRYKAILVDKDNYLAPVVRYIHLNPLGASLVREPQSYLWSSHRLYLRPKEIPKWLQIEEVMAEFENAAGFHEFVLEGEGFRKLLQKATAEPGARERGVSRASA
jgi:REP element-mobilizing transposase RayT